MNEFKEFLLEFLLPVICILFVILFIIGVTVIPLIYYSSCREAKIFNAKYQTDWTCGDFFWAGKQINQQIQTIKLEGIK